MRDFHDHTKDAHEIVGSTGIINHKQAADMHHDHRNLMYRLADVDHNPN